MSAKKNKSASYAEGMNACAAGLALASNPHALGTQERVDWFDGWGSDPNMSFSDGIDHYQLLSSAISEAWSAANSDYEVNPCTECGRHRVFLCNNGKHMCGKCHFCPENEDYAPLP
jgi:hypothetical protein